MNPFYGPQGRRAIAPEIAALIEEQTGSTPVCGFAQILERGAAREAAGDRVSNFCEMHDRREWLLPMSAPGGMAWTTAPVPTGCADRVAFVLSVGFGNGSPLPQPTGQWDISVNDRAAVSIRRCPSASSLPKPRGSTARVTKPARANSSPFACWYDFSRPAAWAMVP